MKVEKKIAKKGRLDTFTIIAHLSLAIFGFIAFLTGDWADDYKKVVHDGFDIHGWLGLAVAAVIAIRLTHGLTGPESSRFSRWVPFTSERLGLVWKGIFNLISLRLPDRQSHRYISGLLKSFGLILFAWMALTGSYMFFFLESGAKANGFTKQVMGMHEVGEALIPLYLVLHIGAVIVHAIFRRQIWRQMVFLR